MDPDPTIAGAGDAGPLGAASARRTTAAGVLISVALHVLAYGAVRAVREPPAKQAPTFTTIDLDLAPVAPAAETLPPEEALAPAAVVPEVPVLAPAVDPDGVGSLDAGIDAEMAVDAGVDARATDARPRRDGGGGDAGEGDAGLDAGADAALVAVVGDGGVEAGDGGVAGGDGGAAGGDGGVASADPDRVGTVGAKVSSGTAANLLGYAPDGHVVTVLARLDRLRGTEWVEPIEAILKPLPDHDALIGDQPVRITDVFETLVISSPEPNRADATTLVGRSARTPAELRDLLDQPAARVLWTPTVGGALGRRQPSKRLIVGDERVFLAWAPGWTTLARPDDLAGLLQPATIGLDHAVAAPDRLPPWLARVATIEDESGTDEGPALMVTAGGMFPALIDLPMVDADIPGPERATLTLTIDPAGFVVRGNLRYPDEGVAATAADAIVRAQRQLSGSTLARFALGQVKAWNAVRNLTVQRTGARVAFSTSISTGDGRVLLGRLADLVAAHFEGLRNRRPRPARRGPDAGVPAVVPPDGGTRP